MPAAGFCAVVPHLSIIAGGWPDEDKTNSTAKARADPSTGSRAPENQGKSRSARDSARDDSLGGVGSALHIDRRELVHLVCSTVSKEAAKSVFGMYNRGPMTPFIPTRSRKKHLHGVRMSALAANFERLFFDLSFCK